MQAYEADKPIKIRIERGKGHYKVYANGEFYCTSDNIKEANEEIEKLKENPSRLTA